MAGATQNKPVRPQVTKGEGVNFSVPYTGIPYDIRKLTADKIAQFENDPYANKVELNLINLIFQTPFILNIQDDKENSREDIAIWMREMCDGIDLWTQMQRCFSSWFWYGAYVHSDGIGKDQNGHIVLNEIRDLPPRTFAEAGTPDNGTLTYGKILNGIMLQGDNKVHYWQKQLLIDPAAATNQTQSKNTLVELKNCAHISSPVFHRYDLAGIPMINPLVQLLSRMSFAWETLVQCNNRAGSPNLFMRVTNPIVTPDGKRNDWKYSDKILRNYNKNTLFTIHDNFEPIELKAPVPDISLKTVEALTDLIISVFSPTDFISKDGTLIGGSTNAESNLLINFITGFHNHLIRAFKPLLQRILEYNGFVGYKVDLQIPAPVFVNEEIQLKKAIELRTSKKGSINEYRNLMGLEDASPEFLEECDEEWKKYDPIPVMNPLANPLQNEDDEDNSQDQGGNNRKNSKNKQSNSGKQLDDEEVKQEEEDLKRNQEAIPERPELERKLEKQLESAWNTYTNKIQKIRVAL